MLVVLECCTKNICNSTIVVWRQKLRPSWALEKQIALFLQQHSPVVETQTPCLGGARATRIVFFYLPGRPASEFRGRFVGLTLEISSCLRCNKIQSKLLRIQSHFVVIINIYFIIANFVCVCVLSKQFFT